jgi:hypothetical protein
LDIYLTTSPASGDVFRGGYFVPFGLDLSGALALVPKRVFVPDAQGGHLFDNQTWSPITNVQFTTIAEAADFGLGSVQGRILEVRVEGSPVTFAAWQAAAFPNPADLANPLVSGPNADPLGTGVPNLLRCALGLGLADNAAARAPQFAGSASAPAIRFPFDAGCSDIGYVVEATSDVTDWSSPTILFDSRTDFPPVAQSGWIAVSDPAPPTQQRYYRLRVSLIGRL